MSMIDLMLEYTAEQKPEGHCREEQCVPTDAVPAQQNSDLQLITDSACKADILFVATNLDSWEADDVRYGYEVMLDDCYRQLDASYYAYLRHMMTIAREHHEFGDMSSKTWDGLRHRFNAIHAWAMEHIGEESLLQAMQSTDPRKYVPPSQETYDDYQRRIDGVPAGPKIPVATGHLFPQDGDFPFTESVSTEAVAKVDAIRDQAEKLGWSQASLYQNRGRHPFPYGQDYGLVCFVSCGHRIGDVTAQSIEIIATGRSGASNRFYNPLANHPWITRSGELRKK